LDFSLQCSRPTAIRYPKGEALEIESRSKFALGKAEVIRKGKDVAILALGSLLKEGLSALDDLANEGIEPLLVNPRFVKPLDEKLLVDIARDFRLLFILEEGLLAGGFGEACLASFPPSARKSSFLGLTALTPRASRKR
jgi:1-deoxy-D-xylulose-5-phosphate synthase